MITAANPSWGRKASRRSLESIDMRSFEIILLMKGTFRGDVRFPLRPGYR
jgi:hypothetical protein